MQCDAYGGLPRLENVEESSRETKCEFEFRPTLASLEEILRSYNSANPNMAKVSSNNVRRWLRRAEFVEQAQNFFN